MTVNMAEIKLAYSFVGKVLVKKEMLDEVDTRKLTMLGWKMWWFTAILITFIFLPF